MKDSDKNTALKVSVIIPVLDDNSGLLKCLKALSGQTYPADKIEIVVVDNGSRDNIKEITDRFDGILVAREVQPGPGAARNKGISLCSGEVIAFTDSDCIPTPDWVERGVEALAASENCGLVAGKIELFYKDPARPKLPELYDTVTYFSQRRYVEKYHFGATANLFTRKSVIDEVGGFDSFFKDAAGEDPDWGGRVFSAGYPQKYAPLVVIKHPAERSMRGLWRKTRRITRGNISLALKGDTCIRESAGAYLVFLYKSIWRNTAYLSLVDKVALSAIAITVVFVKVWEKLAGIVHG